MDPIDFIDLAEAMLRDAPSAEIPQAMLRTVMNRAYLGALMATASRLTRSTGRIYPRDYTFYESVEEDLQLQLPGLGDILATLRTYRRDADYDLETDVSQRKSEQSVRLARTYVTRIHEKFN